MKIPFAINVLLRFVTAALLFICLLQMPYGYYQVTRFFAAFTFIVLGLTITKTQYSIFYQTTFYALAILFQPFFKVAIGRTIWNIIDVIVGVALLISIYVIYRQQNNLKQV
jgi:hypothetical protein